MLGFAQLPLLHSPHARARHRQRHAGQNQQDRERDNQLHQRHAPLRRPPTAPDSRTIHFTLTASGGGVFAPIACPLAPVSETAETATVVSPRPTA